MKIAIIAAALTIVGGAAHAQAWNTVASQNGQTLEFDAASVTDTPTGLSFTARTTFSTPTSYTATDGTALENVAVVVESFEVNCAARTYVDRGVRYADATGTLLAGNRAAGAAKPIGTVTPTLVGGFIATICPA